MSRRNNVQRNAQAETIEFLYSLWLRLGLVTRKGGHVKAVTRR